MTEPVSPAAGEALQELLDVSPQVAAAVVLRRDGGDVMASAPDSTARTASELGATGMRILDAAEQARQELGREPVTQVEVATGDGHVFVVADATHVVTAVTAADPTVGLVFYDLKTALRTVRESGGVDAPGGDASDGSSNGVASNGAATAAATKGARWRRGGAS